MAELQTSNVEEIVDVETSRLKAPLPTLRPLNTQIVTELERSIQNAGLLQPIVIRPTSGSKYEIVFGNHRYEACRRLGINSIPSIVRHLNDDDAFLARVSENLLRNNYIDPIEEARGYKGLVARGWTVNAIGRKVGKCDSYISERLGLLERLSRDLQAQVASGYLTASHAELISRIEDRARQMEVAELVKNKRLSVRSLENLLKGAPPPTKIRLQSHSGECCLHIPMEFSTALGLSDDQHLFMYIRGSKLILDGSGGLGRRHQNRPLPVDDRRDLVRLFRRSLPSHVRMKST